MERFNDALRKMLAKLLSWFDQLIIMLPNFVVALLVFLIFYFISRYTKKIIYRTISRVSQTSALTDLSINVGFFIFILIGLFIALSVLQLDTAVTSLLAGAGIVGLALGFAFQDIAANFVAGILIAIRKPIVVNDVIESKGHFGNVININLRSTVIRTPQGQHVHIPNKDLFNSPIINYSNEGIRRVDLDCGISYGENLENVKNVTLEAIKSIDYVLKSPEITLVYTEFGDSSINFTVRYWVRFHRQFDYRVAMSDGIMKIKAAFDQNDITIPFPIRTLDFGIKGGEKLDAHLKELLPQNKSKEE